MCQIYEAPQMFNNRTKFRNCCDIWWEVYNEQMTLVIPSVLSKVLQIPITNISL
jgi:hypothetical protein